MLLASATGSGLPVGGQYPEHCGFLQEPNRLTISLLEQGKLTNHNRPDLPEYFEDADTTFRIHFTRTGPDGVPPTDDDASGIPDFVEEAMSALLFAYRAFLDTMQYELYPDDAMKGGSQALDVYLLDLSKRGSSGSGLYGSTVPDSILTVVPPHRYTAWIEIDNDFSADDRNAFGLPVFATFGVAALRITCSHELHHVIQIGAYGDAAVQLMVYELTSVWMEIRTYPETNDWMAYTTRLLSQPYLWPFSDPSSSNGYAWGWFANTWYQLKGDGVIRSMWENIRLARRPFQALLDATQSYGIDFAENFCSDMRSLYYTGSRGTYNTIMYNADLLPEFAFAVDENAKSPSAVASGELRPFEVRMFRYTIPSLIDIQTPVVATFILSWPETEAMVNSDESARKSFSITLSTSQLPGGVPIGGTQWYASVSPPELCYVIEGANTARTESPYPQPVNLDQSRIVYVPVHGALPGEEATITLMNMQTVGLAKSSNAVILDDTRIVAPFELPDGLAPATYLLHVLVNGKETLHKVMVKQ